MFLLCLGILISAYLFFHLYWKRRNLPPGPTPLPFFGNLLSFYFTDMDIQFRKWKNEYGDLQTIWFGDKPVVTLHDAPTILQTFLKDGETYAGRDHFKWEDIVRNGRNGIIFSEGGKWRENRRFTLHVFRNFGLGKNLMQERVLGEVQSLVKEIKTEISDGLEEASLQNAIDLAVGSIINNLTFGYRFGKENEDEFQKVKKFATFLVTQGGSPVYRLMDNEPEFYKRFPICNKYYKYFNSEVAKLKTFFFDHIEKHRREIDFESDEDPMDFVEAYLRHQHKQKADGIIDDDNYFDDNQLYATVLDLWIAGQETTSNTLAWLCIFLIQFPQVQRKLHRELDERIGSNRMITLADKNSLNYVNAVVAETQRYCNMVPENVFHRTTRDTEIHGYKLPKNTIITHQISTVLMDERYFPEPETFKPERFLDKNGKFFQPPELMPFGIGKRACLGEGLARLELYLFAANIVNYFKLGYPSDITEFAKRLIGGTTVPAPFLCKIENRF